MVMNRVQFQSGLSLPHFTELYGTEEKCEATPELMRWPDGLVEIVVLGSKMGSAMAEVTNATSAVTVATKQTSPSARSWRQPSCLLPIGS